MTNKFSRSIDYALPISKFLVAENTPLASIHRSVLGFLKKRTDAVVFGAQAVIAYVKTPRMPQDVDVIAISWAVLPESLRRHLRQSLNIAVRVRTVAGGLGFRILQEQPERNRHLVVSEKSPRCRRTKRLAKSWWSPRLNESPSRSSAWQAAPTRPKT